MIPCTVYNAEAPLMQPINLVIHCATMAPPSHQAVIHT